MTVVNTPSGKATSRWCRLFRVTPSAAASLAAAAGLASERRVRKQVGAGPGLLCMGQPLEGAAVEDLPPCSPAAGPTSTIQSACRTTSSRARPQRASSPPPALPQPPTGSWTWDPPREHGGRCSTAARPGVCPVEESGPGRYLFAGPRFACEPPRPPRGWLRLSGSPGTTCRPRCRLSARRVHLRHRRLRLGQVEPGESGTGRAGGRQLGHQPPRRRRKAKIWSGRL